MPHITAQPLPRLHVGQAQAHIGPLTLFPIWTEAPLSPGRRYDPPPTGSVGVVSEREDGPRVEELIIDNSGDAPLLVLEGTTLDGGWQHRVLTRSILAGSRSRTPIPVRCIEQSRWQGSRDQSFSGFDAPLRVRASLRTSHEPSQARVWGHVAAYESSSGRSSRTHSLHALQRETSGAMRDLLRATAPLPAQRGVVVAALGHPVLVEVVDHPDTLASRWEALLSGLALDALDLPVIPTPGYRVRAFVRRMSLLDVAAVPDAGVGLGLEGDDADLVSLRGIADDAGLLHALALNTRHQLVLAA